MRDDGDAYEALVDRVERLTNLRHAQSVLRWDQEVMMPEGGTPARAGQLATLTALHHDLLTHEDLVALLEDLRDADLPPEEASLVREVDRVVTRAVRVPTSLAEEISRATSEALPVWRRAREADDFDAFAPTLERLLELKRREAEHIAPDRDPYEVLFEDHEPYLGLETASRILDEVRATLVPLLDDVRASEADLPAIEGTFPAAEQMALARDVLDLLGYDWDRGRLDTSAHPFSTGNAFDSRITTRFDEAAPLSSLLAAVHEFGHATYTLGLPQEHHGTPLGEARDLTVHESQSRLWENHVGRSLPFWERVLPLMAKRFPTLGDLTPREAYAAANRVDPTNLIRVEADELTYHLHIVLRFDIERALLAGEMDVADVPAAWNDRMERDLGVRPASDADGCLQDIHWAHAGFGYFPTYTLGSVLAAQLDAALRRDVPDLDQRVGTGDVGAIHRWLGEKVHQHGARYPTDELVRRATGKDLEARDFAAYVETKFGALYG